MAVLVLARAGAARVALRVPESPPTARLQVRGRGGLYRSLDFFNGYTGVRQRQLTVDLSRVAGLTVSETTARPGTYCPGGRWH